jgi:hypothetical protein
MKKESLAARLDRPPVDALRGQRIDVDQSKHNGPRFGVTNFESTIANDLGRQKSLQSRRFATMPLPFMLVP